MREWSLELTDTNGETLFHLIVEPSLLQNITTASRRIDGEIESQPIECLSRESKDSIRNGKPGIMHIVLIIGGIQPFVVVIIHAGAGLHQHIGLKHEIALLRGDGEALLARQRYDTVLGVFFILGPRPPREQQEDRDDVMYEMSHFLTFIVRYFLLFNRPVSPARSGPGRVTKGDRDEPLDLTKVNPQG